MNLAQARTAVEANFRSIRDEPRGDGWAMASGGPLVKGEPRALYITEDLAVDEWMQAMLRSFVGEKTSEMDLIWIERPRLERFEITIADAQRTQRLAQDRYIVLCRCRIGKA